MALQVLSNIACALNLPSLAKTAYRGISIPLKAGRNTEFISNLVSSFVRFPRLALELLPLPR
jgi:hypothetical protein